MFVARISQETFWIRKHAKSHSMPKELSTNLYSSNNQPKFHHEGLTTSMSPRKDSRRGNNNAISFSSNGNPNSRSDCIQ